MKRKSSPSAFREDHAVALWTFSLSVYDNIAVQTECLDLQDRYGIDVNLLMFCTYVGAVHRAILSDAELRQAVGVVGGWHKDIVHSLRKAWRALKPFATEPALIVSSAATLRAGVKTMELEAERLEHTMLEEWSALRVDAWPRAQVTEAIVANIKTLFAICDVSAQRPDLPKHLVAAALATARRQI